jgi:hypothetical protein
VAEQKGYHSPDPNWRETPPSEAGLGFVSRRFGGTLVISTFNEISYVHHHYYLDDLRIHVPAGVQVVKEARKLSGNGAGDLHEP